MDAPVLRIEMTETICEIPMKLPSLNIYINECRKNKFAGAKMKADYEEAIGWFVKRLTPIKKPCIIHFTWIEKTQKRDADNLTFGKKFILDAMVKCGVLPDDSRKWVKGFTDTIKQGADYKVIVEVEQ